MASYNQTNNTPMFQGAQALNQYQQQPGFTISNMNMVPMQQHPMQNTMQFMPVQPPFNPEPSQAQFQPFNPSTVQFPQYYPENAQFQPAPMYFDPNLLQMTLVANNQATPSPTSSIYGQPLIPLNPQFQIPVQALNNGLQQLTVNPQTFTFPEQAMLSPSFAPANAEQETAQSASLQAPARANPSPSPVPVRTHVAPATQQDAWGLGSTHKKDPTRPVRAKKDPVRARSRNTRKVRGAKRGKPQRKYGHRSKQDKIHEVLNFLKDFYTDQGLFAKEKELVRGSDTLRIHVKTFDGLTEIKNALWKRIPNDPSLSIRRIAIVTSKKNTFQLKGFIVYLKLGSAQEAHRCWDILKTYPNLWKEGPGKKGKTIAIAEAREPSNIYNDVQPLAPVTRNVQAVQDPKEGVSVRKVTSAPSLLRSQSRSPRAHAKKAVPPASPSSKHENLFALFQEDLSEDEDDLTMPSMLARTSSAPGA